MPAPPDGPGRRRHLLYVAIGFPPAAKSSTYRLRETANQMCAAGWDVTVVTIARDSWELESGIDTSLLDGVDPRVRVVELPLRRADLETDIRRFPEARAADPVGWVKKWRARNQESFPEPVFGGWRPALERAVLDLHRARPVDLTLTTSTPYVTLCAARALWERHRIPYAVDFRDGWSVDVVGSRTAFGPDSPEGRWEREVLDEALSLWVVNDPIAEHYRTRYPHLADRVKVVRNGYDVDSAPDAAGREPCELPLTFGYLGLLSSPVGQLRALLDAWRLARATEPLLADARFEVRGHGGFGADRGGGPKIELLRRAEDVGVHFGGPVNKADVAGVYAGWDALVLLVLGGRYMTSGKVYEYMAAGLPIVSAHADDHDASSVLEGHPLWTGACGLDRRKLADGFAHAARLAVGSGPAERLAAQAHARPFERSALMAAGARDLTARMDRRTLLTGVPTP
ncbi:glycosyltransferase [Streptomyces sp. N35]|uniref:glycosyltransferase n=1 Tax=Streptomyces sp. N35 TaxID=2795730 RepID=UPI0018F79F00|nr:glycosyltransferase [Streptomyces sp. N35]